MNIQEITSKEIWEGFLFGCEEKTFLSSWGWGEFQKKEGNKIWRLGAYNNNELLEVALAVKIKAKRGSFLFIPQLVSKDHGLHLVNKLKEIAISENLGFIRISPIWERNEKNIEAFRKLGFKEAPIHMHPELTWELDISSDEETILKNMRKTTRYLIRQAEKNEDVKIVKSKDLEKFMEVYKETVDRHNFVPFSLNYLKNQFESFSNEITLFLGEYKGEVVSSAIIVYWQGTGFYHHGASTTQKVPVSYLLQWEAIKEAKRRGCNNYNFWGIAPDMNKKHPWYGLTLFKMGFGGQRKEYVKTQDLPLSWSYNFTRLFESLRKIKRRL